MSRVPPAAALTLSLYCFLQMLNAASRNACSLEKRAEIQLAGINQVSVRDLDLATLGERQVDEQTSAFASLCEPVVIVALGALVGGVLVAMYLPIVQLGNVV